MGLGKFWKKNASCRVGKTLRQHLERVIRCKCELISKNPCGTNICSCRKNGIKCMPACGNCHGNNCNNQLVRYTPFLQACLLHAFFIRTRKISPQPRCSYFLEDFQSYLFLCCSSEKSCIKSSLYFSFLAVIY